MSRKNSGYLLVFSAGILWGTIGLFVKQMELGGSSPVETAFLRVFFAFLILLVICICRGGWRSLRADSRTLFICALLGIVCHGICNIFIVLPSRWQEFPSVRCSLQSFHLFPLLICFSCCVPRMPRRGRSSPPQQCPCQARSHGTDHERLRSLHPFHLPEWH